MKILDPIHALILFDEKKLTPRKTLLVSSSGIIYKFIRVDTNLNWPRVIVLDQSGNEIVLTGKELRMRALTVKEPELSEIRFEAI